MNSVLIERVQSLSDLLWMRLGFLFLCVYLWDLFEHITVVSEEQGMMGCVYRMMNPCLTSIAAKNIITMQKHVHNKCIVSID